MTRFILVDGNPVAAIHALDRGLQFGDGLFETMAVVNGRIRLLQRHLKRLLRDSARLSIQPPSPALLREELGAAAERLSDGVIKLIVTRGSGGRGYRLPVHPVCRRILVASEWQPVPQRVRLMLCETRLAAGGSLAGIKHLNRLEQVLACAEWQKVENVDEGLMLDPDGNVIEATSANLFIVSGNNFVTPALNHCGVKGVMREQVIELINQSGRSCQIDAVSIEDVSNADEVFLTNSLSRIRPVIALHDRTWETGPMTVELQRALSDKLKLMQDGETD